MTMPDASQASDGFKIRGDITIAVRCAKTGALKRRYEVRNTIAYVGLGAILKLLGDGTYGTSGDGLIAWIQPGGGDTGSAPSPTPPARTDTSVENAFAGTQVAGSEYAAPTACAITAVAGPPAVHRVRVTATVPSTDLNGKTINEVALLLADETLLARQIQPNVDKDGAVTVDYTWDISLTA